MSIPQGENTLQCPVCQEASPFQKAIRVSAFPSTETGWSPHFRCFNCKNFLQFQYEVRILEVHASESPVFDTLPIASPVLSSLSGKLSDSELQLIKDCRAKGIFDVFAQAVTEERQIGGVPRDMESFFIGALNTAVPAKLPLPIMREFRKQFGWVEFWHSQGIGMVLSGGKICRFIPMKVLKLAKKPTGDLAKNLGINRTNGNEGLEWMKRTTIGYVPPESRIFLEALRHCAGDRGREMRAVPIRP